MVKAAVGLPEHVIFQSWIWNHAGRKTVPTNVPETNDFTHTNLVNRGLTLLVDNDAGLAATQSPPPSMKAGASFPLVVSCVNKGPVAWTKKRGYELGIQVFQGNSCVGVERVALTDDETIAPGASKTFHFSVNAPLAPGGYVYRWQMFQQMGNWLGTPSPSYQIQVTP
jgi:hypothetical protein